MFEVLKTNPSTNLFGTYQFPTTARGLLWTRKGATKFLDEGHVISMSIDHYLKDWLTRAPGGYCLAKPVVHGINASTVIGTGRPELRFSEAIWHDIARGKRDFSNNFVKFKRKFIFNTMTILGLKNYRFFIVYSLAEPSTLFASKESWGGGHSVSMRH